MSKQLEMRAIVHSVHSQVPLTVAKMRRPPDLIVSLDSHLDVSLGGDNELYPPALRVFARRTGAHAALRNITGGVSALSGMENVRAPKLVVVIPLRMLQRHVTEAERQLPRSLRIADEEVSMSSWVRFLKRKMGIEVFESPPRPLEALISRTRGRPWLLDIDVDYIHEMQKECYTRVINPGPGVLQSMSGVVDLLRRSRPETVTISEVRVSAVKSPASGFSGLREEMESMGYEFDETAVYESDEEVTRGIAVCKEFYRTISKRLTAEHMDSMLDGDMGGFHDDEREAAKRFFEGKGYS
jgi:hypothetical protein